MLASIRMGLDYVAHIREHNVHRAQFKEEDEQNVKGSIVIVTGSNSGLGKETAREMAKRGAVVIMACRDLTKGQEAVNEIMKDNNNATLDLVKLDLEDLDSVREFVRIVKDKYPRVDILINNAGISEPKIKRTKHGFESNMGVNHLGPFLLTLLLIDHLEKSNHGRIVCVSSSMLYLARLNINDLMLERQSGGFLNYVPYSNSKLANALFVKQLAKVLMKTGITCYAICPGLVTTNVFRNEPWYRRILTEFSLTLAGFSPERGCENTLYCALSNSLATESGCMYRFLGRWDKIQEKLDDTLALQLWEKSEELVGLPGFSQKFKAAN